MERMKNKSSGLETGDFMLASDGLCPIRWTTKVFRLCSCLGTLMALCRSTLRDNKTLAHLQLCLRGVRGGRTFFVRFCCCLLLLLSRWLSKVRKHKKSAHMLRK